MPTELELRKVQIAALQVEALTKLVIAINNLTAELKRESEAQVEK